LINSTTLDEKGIRDALSRLLHQQAPASILGGLLVAIILVVVNWSATEQIVLFSWLALLLTVSFVRGCAWYVNLKGISDKETPGRWRKQIKFLLCCSGLIWASAAWSFSPENDSVQMGTMIAIMAVLIAGAMGPLAPSLLAFILYSSPIMLAISSRLIVSDIFHPLIGLGFVLYFCVCIMYTRNMQLTMTELITLRFNNEALIEKMTKNSEVLVAAVQSAEKANADKTRFLAIASHDLAQPLHAMELFMSALKRERTASKQQSLIENASRSTTMLSEMFASLLDLSRLDAQTMEPFIERIDLSTVLQPLVSEFSSRCEAKQLFFRYECDEVLISTDIGLLRRIVLNLLSNALNNTKEGMIGLKTYIDPDPSNTRFWLEVSDTGSGMAYAVQQKIFDEHYQVEPGENKGLGIGLTVVNELCQLLNIDVELDSSPGGGTRFRLALDSETVSETVSRMADTHPQVRSGNQLAADTDYLLNLKILYIDDDEASRNGMSALLSLWQSEHYCLDGIRALRKKLEDDKFIPDIVISDYRLSYSETGVDVHQLLKSLGLASQFLIVTGDTTTDVINEIRQLQLPYLAKPIAESELKVFCQQKQSV
jgi:signal transduction histidine kinase